MQKRFFIIHGWGGSPTNYWFPWLKNELEKKGFIVTNPSMPQPENPTIENWVGYLTEIVGEADENTYFVGHSIGCQAILRYIEKIQKPIGGIVCVAGFLNSLNLDDGESEKIAKPWLETPMNYEKVKKNAEKIIAIFSDDDESVGLENKDLFEKFLAAKTIVEHNMGHFSGDAGIKELPSALDAVLEISGKNQ